MRLLPPYIQALADRPPFFDGADYPSAELAMTCGKCNGRMAVNLISFVDQAADWLRHQPETERRAITAHFGCTWKEIHGRQIVCSHDKGEPYFGLQACGSCGAQSLVYVSFYERQPGRYVATLQGAALVAT